MGNFNRSKFGSSRSFGGTNFGGNRNRERPQMHDAVCSNCGKACQVPFKPTGEKPVYCRDCFAKMNPEDSRKGFGRNDRNKRSAFRTVDQHPTNASGQDQQLQAMNAKLDKIVALLTGNTAHAKETILEEVLPTKVDTQETSQDEKSAEKDQNQ